jgi:chemotaxis protein CheX
MYEKYINPFLESFASVIPQIGLLDVKKKGISLKGRNIESQGVMIIVGIMGDIKGNVMYSTTIDTAKKIASAMMGTPVDELGELAQSAIAELSNILTANAATNFSVVNIDVNISPPALMQGYFTANSSTDKVLCVEMLVNDMDFVVNIALEKL